MKTSIKIIMAAFALSLVSCIAATNGYDSYSQGYSDGYIDGYYQSPDGYWYAPNVVYLDYNGSYYQNGQIYQQRLRSRDNIIVSPKNNNYPGRKSSVRKPIPNQNQPYHNQPNQNQPNQNPRNTPSMRTTHNKQENPQREIINQQNNRMRQ